MASQILNQEFLASYYQVPITDIQGCLSETAILHKTTATKVTKIVIGSTEMKLHLLSYDVILPMISTLPIESIINLCKTSKKFAAICEDNRVWKFLLKRDFGIVYTKKDGARKRYIRTYSFSPMVSCGFDHTGYITENKDLEMWGNNESGQVGGSKKVVKYPTTIMKNVVYVSCGYTHTGAITTDGKLYMWGQNDYGQLGNGTRKMKKKPILIKIKGNPRFVQVSCGWNYTGAVTKEGKLYMWGENWNGQLGDDKADVKDKPTFVMNDIAQVSCGTGHTGAITREGELYTWGYNSSGQLGDNTVVDKTKPTLIKIKNLRVIQISCGGRHTGAVTEGGKFYIWGANDKGQIGDGTMSYHKKPMLILKDTAQISCGKESTGVVSKDGRLYMWGNLYSGRMSQHWSSGNKPTIPKFIFIPSLHHRGGAVQVSCGNGHAGMVAESGTLYMVGWNKYGQLGDKTTKGKTNPIIVAYYGWRRGEN